MTMATITVVGIPDGLLASLRVAADSGGRSLNRQVVVLLARSVGCSRAEPTEAGSGMGARCIGAGCLNARHRAEARAVGWGGP